MLRLFCVIMAFFWLSGGPPGMAQQPPEPASDPASVALRLIHDGRFDEADEALDRAGAPGEDVAIAFHRALVTYWRLLYDPENSALKQVLEDRLQKTLDGASDRLERLPDDPQANLWAGTSHLLLGELRASQDRPISGALEGRRAKQVLEGALRADPSLTDAGFGLGTLNVLADRLAGLARGIGSLLGLSGDRDAGLAQLERAAESGRFFSLEARLSLIAIYSHRKERRFSEALSQARMLLDSKPVSLAALDGAARVEVDLGITRSAARHLDEALARATAARRTDPLVVAALLFQKARAEFALFRPDLALDALRRLAEIRAPLPPRLRGEALALARKACPLARRPPGLGDTLAQLGETAGATACPEPAPAVLASWEKALPALEKERANEIGLAADQLEALSSSSPADPVLGLLAGRALLLCGRSSEARNRLVAAEASGRLPGPWLGLCRLLAGQAADLAGDRSAALASYQKAEAAPSFVGRDAVHLYRVVPYRGLP